MRQPTRADGGVSEILTLSVPADRVSCFFPLLQKGFVLGALAGRPIRAFLREGLGLTDEYIDTRIQTVFLDGKPVDDIDEALLRDGATLALAPAMPGLMGAMLRRGGYYAPMRSGITHRGDAAPHGIVECSITVKLFGMALRELGPQLLALGVGVDAGDLAKVVSGLPEDCRDGLGSMAELDGQARVILRVTIAQEGKGTRD